LDAVFGLVCHQIPSRSASVDGASFPLCFRCMGMYTAIAVATPFWFLARSERRLDRRALKLLVLLSIGLAPMVADGTGNHLGLWDTADPIRTVTGILAGCSLVALVAVACRDGLPKHAAVWSVLSPSAAVALLIIVTWTGPGSLTALAVVMLAALIHLLARLAFLVAEGLVRSVDRNMYRSGDPR
jgi:uncharacterized membrane protein